MDDATDFIDTPNPGSRGGPSTVNPSTASNNAEADQSNQLGDAADEEEEEAQDVGLPKTQNEALASLLSTCHRWWQVHARRTGLCWAFMVPDDDAVLTAAVQGLTIPKNHAVCCWVCHMHTTGELHSSYPVAPDSQEGVDAGVEGVAGFLCDVDPLPESDMTNISLMNYKQQSSSTHLRQHVSKHHSQMLKMLQTSVGDGQPTPASTASGSSLKHKAMATIDSSFNSIKRLKTDSPRQLLFNQLLTLAVIFLRWSFSVVEHPWFRALVWFLDARIVIPNRKQWQRKHLPTVLQETHRSVMSALSGVLGVSLMFDLWMSRNGEDVLSLDIAFIDRKWNYTVKNIGIVHCREGTRGVQVAAAIRPYLERHRLMDKIYAYVKDQGGNLVTTANALSSAVTASLNVGCRALAVDRPFKGDCYAHAINGGCNKAVIAARKVRQGGMDVEASLKKMREVCTYIKKSSVALKAYVIACRQSRITAKKIPTPAKTRFTSVSRASFVR